MCNAFKNPRIAMATYEDMPPVDEKSTSGLCEKSRRVYGCMAGFVKEHQEHKPAHRLSMRAHGLKSEPMFQLPFYDVSSYIASDVHVDAMKKNTEEA